MQKRLALDIGALVGYGVDWCRTLGVRLDCQVTLSTLLLTIDTVRPTHVMYTAGLTDCAPIASAVRWYRLTATWWTC
jgi:hypothetical protein